MDQWFYLHLGRTFGPVTADDLRNLAATGRLEPADRIWRQDISPNEAVPAGSVLVFFLAGGKPTPPVSPPLAFPPAAPAPEWLRDLIDSGEAAEAASPPAEPAPAPDWLRDVSGAEQKVHPRKRKAPPS